MVSSLLFFMGCYALKRLEAPGFLGSISTLALSWNCVDGFRVERRDASGWGPRLAILGQRWGALKAITGLVVLGSDGNRCNLGFPMKLRGIKVKNVRYTNPVKPDVDKCGFGGEGLGTDFSLRFLKSWGTPSRHHGCFNTSRHGRMEFGANIAQWLRTPAIISHYIPTPMNVGF